MDKTLLTTLLWLALPFLVNAQKKVHFGERIIVGTSVTYISDHNKPLIDNSYVEVTWDKNITVSLSQSLYVGLSHKHIFTRGSQFFEDIKSKGEYSMLGTFLQYDFIPKRKSRFIGEIAYHFGDYCTCGSADPYRVKNLHYLGWGFGYDLPLWKGLSLDLGFNAHYILNEIPLKYSYTQYVVGLNYFITL